MDMTTIQEHLARSFLDLRLTRTERQELTKCCPTLCPATTPMRFDAMRSTSWRCPA